MVYSKMDMIEEIGFTMREHSHVRIQWKLIRNKLETSPPQTATETIILDYLVWRPERGETEELKGEEQIFQNRALQKC